MLNTLKLEDIKPMLINLTGVRLLIIFSLLLESPKTAEEINEYFIRNNYPNEHFSIDTLRSDLNSLRLAGCTISRADKHNRFKYNLTSHPFELTVDMDIAKNISKIYNRTYKYLSITHLMLIDDLFNELAKHTINDSAREVIKGISLVRNIDKKILNDLIKAKSEKNKISFLYRSYGTSKRKMECVVENFEIRNRKLYFNGYFSEFNGCSFLPVSKIISPITFFLKNESVHKNICKIVYELKNIAKINFEENDEEKILKKDKDKITVEFVSENSLKTLQKILSYGSNCTVISPKKVKMEIIDTLKRMREVYNHE